MFICGNSRISSNQSAATSSAALTRKQNGMAKLLKKTFGLGTKKAPPQPPKPDYRGGAVGGDSEDDESSLNAVGGHIQGSGTSRNRQAGSPTSPAASSSQHHQSSSTVSATGHRGGPTVGPRSSSIAGSSTSSIARLRNDGVSNFYILFFIYLRFGLSSLLVGMDK